MQSEKLHMIKVLKVKKSRKKTGKNSALGYKIKEKKWRHLILLISCFFTLLSAFILLFNHFLEARAEVGFLKELKTRKNSSEIF